VNALVFLLVCSGLTPSVPAHGGYVVAIGGDVSLARGTESLARTSGWSEVLAPMSRALKGADARIVNLESAIGPCLPECTVARPRLCGQAQGLAALIDTGITAVTVANNHALDAGPSAFENTVEILESSHVAVLGRSAVRSGEPVSETLGPIQVIAANLSRPAHPPGRDIPLPTPEALAAAITRAKRANVDRPILVILHGGREFGDEPSGLERGFADVAVDAGAAAVVFHGAHVVHPMEYVRGVPVHFGLGNLLFDQRDPRAAGQVILLRFQSGRPVEVVEVRGIRQRHRP
jgi:poly-gamma-glutamate capsule biosynthesis protein CapA/YwtB (metallophosphatase superfamily)